MRILLLFVFFSLTKAIFAQDSTLKFSGYIETYYAFDAEKPLKNYRRDFVYSHNRHNELNLNLGFVKASYLTENIRGNLALMVGTYASANLAAEDPILQHVFEGNIGVKLAKMNNVWLDAGILPSHLGFESAIGKDCYTLTRSILADNSPYFETGVRVSYTTNDGVWYVSGLLLNGWQNIRTYKANFSPSVGYQLQYRPSSSVLLNSSFYAGNEATDERTKMRYFHNLFGQFSLNKAISIIAGLDYGIQRNFSAECKYDHWFSPVLITQFAIADHWKMAIRGEMYSDKNHVIISSNNPSVIKAFSMNLDREIFNKALWRIEGKIYGDKERTLQPLFTTALCLPF